MTDASNHKKSRKRSPRAPSLNLKSALEKARAFYDKEPSHSAPAEVVLEHMGHSAKSSGGIVALASLRGFGLVENRGNEVALTETALDIIQDERPESSERAAAIRRIALRPKVHANVLEKYKGKMPSDETLRFYLRREMKFTDSGAHIFIKQFRETLAYAGILNDGKLPPDESAKKKDEPAALQQRAITGGWQPGKDERRPRLPFASGTGALTPRPTMNQDTFTLAEGQVVLQWPSSISPDDYQDLEVWLGLMGRRMKRAVATADDKETESE